MNGLSDLELVAQAMAPTQTPQLDQSTQLNQPDHDPNFPAPPPQSIAANPSCPAPSDPTSQDPLANLDLSTLSPSDREMLQPLIDVLSLSELPDGEEYDERMAEISAQMDVVALAADDLEGKLDRLLENLGRVEEEIEKDLPRLSGADQVRFGGEQVEKGGGEDEKGDRER